jgi:hypothetical protein
MSLQSLRGAVALGVVLLAQACTTVVIPPADPAEPRPVFLLDHGRHASLVLPAGDAGMIRYEYGDWRWFALRQTGPFEATGALLWPTRAGLGRRWLPGPPDAPSVQQQVAVVIEDLHVVTVEAVAVARLRAELEALFAAGANRRVVNAAYDLDFVPHPERYSAFHNSNTVVAGWLSRLGCRVRGIALLSRWRVAPPPSSPSDEAVEHEMRRHHIASPPHRAPGDQPGTGAPPGAP